MKLDRNIPKLNRRKYALIKLRVGLPFKESPGSEWRVPSNAVDFGNSPDTDFFVIRLKDKYSYDALRAYSLAAAVDDPEYAQEIMDLAHIAKKHPSKRKPD